MAINVLKDSTTRRQVLEGPRERKAHMVSRLRNVLDMRFRGEVRTGRISS